MAASTPICAGILTSQAKELELLEVFLDPTIAGQFRSQTELRQAGTGKAALEKFNARRFEAWLKALAYLDSIPNGQLVANRAVFDTLHLILNSYLEEAWNPLMMLPKGTSRYRPGAPRWYPSLQLQNRHKEKPLTDDMLAKMRSIPGGPSYIELPWSQPGNRRVLHHYRGWGVEVRDKLNELEKFYTDNFGIMDPVRFAAEWSQRFVSVHPYNDSVGKITRLVANRILNEFGLPPALLEKHDELAMPLDDLVNEYREGIRRFKDFEKKQSRF